MKTLKIIEIKAINVNLMDSRFAVGGISLFGIHGFTKNLELKINKNREEVKIDYFLPFVKTILEKNSLKSKDRSMMESGIHTFHEGFIELDLLIEVESNNVENLNSTIKNIARKNRFLGGSIIDINVTDFEEKFISGKYPEIKNRKEDIFELVIKNILYFQKGVTNVLRIGELILADLDVKSTYGFPVSMSTPIFGEVEWHGQKWKEKVKDIFDNYKISLEQNQNTIKLTQGVKNV